MEDLRKKSKLSVKGHYLTAGLQVTEDSVKEMLTFMGVDPEPILQEAVGYLSSNGMEINMSNLGEFLKTKQVMSNRVDTRLKKK